MAINMAPQTKTKRAAQSRKQGQSRQQVDLKAPSVAGLLILATVLLTLLLVAESGQIFFQLKRPIKETLKDQSPVYILDSQPIDFEAYLAEFFANETPKKTMHVTVTAYSSTNGQTDDTPFLTAIGTPVREGVVAANFLPVGTVIRFPDKFDDKFFIVEDRMHERFGLQVDIWMSNQEEAKEFGIQYLKMEIF